MIWILLMRLLDTIRRWRARRATIRQLSRLDDHLLKDIGIDRWQVECVARKLAESKPASGAWSRRGPGPARPGWVGPAPCRQP